MTVKKVVEVKKVKELTPEEKVVKYLKSTKRDMTSLHFRYAGTEKIKDDGDLEKLVSDILDRTYCRGSLNKDNLMETGSGRWRTVTDIWRHVLELKPKRSIFAVMRSLYELSFKFNDDEELLLVGQICHVIKQRTFKLGEHTDYRHDLADRETKDEFGLVWEEWKEIGLHYTYKKWKKLLGKEVNDESKQTKGRED